MLSFLVKDGKRWQCLGLRGMAGSSVFHLQRFTGLTGVHLQPAKHMLFLQGGLVVLSRHLLLNQEVAGGRQRCKTNHGVDTLSLAL